MKAWGLWEVFVRSQNGLVHRHIGGVRAVDGNMALEHARDVYGRRNEAASIWVVASENIVASDPAERAALFESASKDFRHPTYYPVPEGVEYL